MARFFRITGDNDASGAEFETDCDEVTEEEIAEAAFERAIEFFSFGWVEIDKPNGKPLTQSEE
jgi:hypothetical protein